MVPPYFSKKAEMTVPAYIESSRSNTSARICSDTACSARSAIRSSALSPNLADWETSNVSWFQVRNRHAICFTDQERAPKDRMR